MKDKVIIQNKRNGRRECLTAEQYKKLKDVGFAGGWTIIKWIDETEETYAPKTLPKDLVDFSQITRKKKKTQKQK